MLIGYCLVGRCVQEIMKRSIKHLKIAIRTAYKIYTNRFL
ncbi:hypothetical protein N499_0071 [Wolbachia pipientis wVitA]|nr:hypothetical protein N499_0071 [Wolbachia pipientis wVitA]